MREVFARLQSNTSPNQRFPHPVPCGVSALGSGDGVRNEAHSIDLGCCRITPVLVNSVMHLGGGERTRTTRHCACAGFTDQRGQNRCDKNSSKLPGHFAANRQQEHKICGEFKVSITDRACHPTELTQSNRQVEER